MYKVYIGKIRLPIPPEAIETTIDGNNQTIELINGGERVIPKSPHLKKIKFTILLPNHKYPFAYYNNGFHRAKWYYTRIKNMQTKKQIIKLKIIRKLPDGKTIWKGGMKKAIIEDTSLKEDAGKLGQDMELTLTFKLYKTYKTKKKKVRKENILVTLESVEEDIRSAAENVKKYCNGLPESVAQKIMDSFHENTEENPTPEGIEKARKKAKDQMLHYWAKGKI